MGVSKESINKFLIGNRFHVKLRIPSRYSNRSLFEIGLRMRNFTWNRFPTNNLLIDSLLTRIVESTYSYTSCDSLQNRLVPFQFAITFHKIFGFSFEATLSWLSIIHRKFKDVSNQTKSEAQNHFLYNKAQPTSKCNLGSVIQVIQKEVVQAPKAWSKHRFNVIHESEDHKTIPAHEKILTQIVKKEISIFEATKKRSNKFEKLFHALITIKPKSAEPESFFSATRY